MVHSNNIDFVMDVPNGCVAEAGKVNGAQQPSQAARNPENALDLLEDVSAGCGGMDKWAPHCIHPGSPKLCYVSTSC